MVREAPDSNDISTILPDPDVREMSSKEQSVCIVQDVAVTDRRGTSDRVIDLKVTVVNERDPAVSVTREVERVGVGVEASPVKEMLVRETDVGDSLVMNVPAEIVTDIDLMHTIVDAVRASAVLGIVNASPSRDTFTPSAEAPVMLSSFSIVP